MVEVQELVACPACGTDLSRERWSGGLCPACLIELALDDTGLEAELEPDEAPTLQFTPDATFAEGEIQGDRYRIRSLLGRGGMGEVWRAYDLKLRQDVALKALRTELVKDPAALERGGPRISDSLLRCIPDSSEASPESWTGNLREFS